MLHSKIGAGGYVERPARVRVTYDAVLTESDGTEVDVMILNVSGVGFRLHARSELLPGSEVVLSVPMVESVRALIRWTKGLEAGGVFLDPVAL